MNEPSKGGARLAGIFLVLLAAAGCNTILGIEEATCVAPCDAPDEFPVGQVLREGETPPADGVAPDAAHGAGVPPGREGPAGPLPLDPRDGGALIDATDLAAACAALPSEKPFCVANQRVVCRPDGTVRSVDLCSDVDHCLRGNEADCATCPSDTFVCKAAELWGCDPSIGAMVPFEDCASAPLCNAHRGVCEAPVCSPGRRRCLGPELQVCAADGTRFDVLDSCASAELCDSTKGACAAPACTPNQRRCQGRVLQECNASRTGFQVIQECTSASACDAKAGVCGTAGCVPGQRRCQGAVLQRCNAGGTAFQDVESCQSAGRCDAQAGRCRPEDD